jgi:hypothetical protein
MLRGITKKHKHTHRRRTMRKKNRTMRRRHSSHLKHSRRNLHRMREGGAKPSHFFAKGVVKATKAYITEEKMQNNVLNMRDYDKKQEKYAKKSVPPNEHSQSNPVRLNDLRY